MLVSNVAAHAPLAAKVLQAHDVNTLETLQLATEDEEGRQTWSRRVVEALDDAKSTKLERVDAGAAVPKNFSAMFSQNDVNAKKKKQILDSINDNRKETLHEKLAHSRDVVEQVRARSSECLELSRSRWRGMETLQSAPPNAHTLQELRNVCPAAREPIDEDVNEDIDDYFENGEGALTAIDTAAVRKAIKSAPKGRTKDIEGVRFEHWQGVVKYAGDEALGALTLLIETMARNPRAAFKTIAKARMVGIPKKETQIRPIGITSVLRRIRVYLGFRV